MTSSTSDSETRTTLWPNSSTMSAAVSGSIAWFCVAMMPFCIRVLTTAATRSAMRLASSCTVIASGTCTSRTTFSRSPRVALDAALLALLPALHRRHRALAAFLVGGVGDRELARAAAVVLALAAAALLLDGRRLLAGLLRADRAAGLGAGGDRLRGGRIDRRRAASRRGGAAARAARRGRAASACSAAAAAARCSWISRSFSRRSAASFSARSRASSASRASATSAPSGGARPPAPWRPRPPSAGARTRRPRGSGVVPPGRPGCGAARARRAWGRGSACACARR